MDKKVNTPCKKVAVCMWMRVVTWNFLMLGCHYELQRMQVLD